MMPRELREIKSSLRNNILITFFLLIALGGITTNFIMNREFQAIIAGSGLDNTNIANIGRHFTIISTGLTIAGIFIASIIAIFLSNAITKPIKQLTRGMMDIAQGRFTTRMDISNQDEIGQLAAGFNNMAKQIETALESVEAAKDYTDNIVVTVPSILIVLSDRLNILSTNMAYEKLHKKYSNIQLEEFIEPLKNDIIRNLKTGKPLNNEIVITPQGSGIRLVFSTIISQIKNKKVTSEEEKARVLLTITDITEHKKLEELLFQSQKMEAVGQLAGGIAHDFNNILTAIMSYGNILQMKLDKDNDELRPYVNSILTVSEKAATLTQSLLSFSRKQIINPVPSDMNTIIKKSEHLLSRVISEDVEFRTELTAKDLNIMADSTQIEQVLMNLATNACHVMSKGGRLSIKTERVELDEGFGIIHEVEKPGIYALLSVTDTGSGMDEETKRRMFEPFFTTKEMGKGTGLGLSITYGIIKQHNGFINVTSEKGKGTTFRIYLPLIEEKADEEIPEEIPLIGGTETLLVAEDEADVRVPMALILQEYGFTVIQAVDGEDAIEKFMENKEKIQLLVLDIVMPKRKGNEVYDEIKKVRPDIKAIFTSGYKTGVINTEGVSDDKPDLISKPVLPGILLRKIREVLDT